MTSDSSKPSLQRILHSVRARFANWWNGLAQEPEIELDAIALEERILYSATPLLVAGDPTSEVPDQLASIDDALLQALDADLDQVMLDAQALSSNVEATPELRHEVAFVDASLDDLDQLLNEIRDSAAPDTDLEIVLVDHQENGIQAISDYLRQEEQLVDAIYVYSHANASGLQLGSEWIDFSEGSTSIEAMLSWKSDLSENADLVLYGCSIASTEVGQEWLGEVSELLSVDVAASTDLTGSVERNGDWILEYQTGSIEATIDRSEGFASEWDSVLATYTVTNTSDSGAGSLRQAILDANANSGADTIQFNISTGAQTISLLSALPTLTGQVTLDGWTQGGYSSTPLIVIDANGVTGDGFVLTATADNSIIRGFVLRDFVGDGIQIDSGSTGNTIVGNYIGSFGAGGTNLGVNEQNTGVGIRILGDNNIIGGTTAATRNVIGGNQSHGIFISGASATYNTIQGNYIGTDATGATATANLGAGIEVTSSNNTIGGTTTAHRNVISGNSLEGIDLTGTSANYNTISNNYIGLNASGTSALANTEIGIDVEAGASNNTIGGASSSLGNVISGNTQFGVRLTDSSTSNNTIQYNYIGTNAAGTAAVSNGSFGIVIDYAAVNSTINNNLISGNTNTGWSASRGGIYLYGNGVTIQGNTIGLSSTGAALGNGGAVSSTGGIIEAGGSSNVRIGGTSAGQGNIIASNTGDGIIVLGQTSTTILGNTIYGNTGQAIDLDNDGITYNDVSDADSGRLNFPVLKTATTINGDTKITGKVSGLANTTFRVEFFSNGYGLADSNGYGEARVYLGSTSVTTDANGNGVIDQTISNVTLSVGSTVSATATIDNGGGSYGITSEMAGNIVVDQANLFISGSYVGNGVDDRLIAGLGFRAEAILIMSNQGSVIRTSTMAGDASKVGGSASSLTSNLIQSITGDGFTVGTNSVANASGVTYHWVAFGAGDNFDVGSYTGNGSTKTISGVGFQAEATFVMGNVSQQAVMRTNQSSNTFDLINGAGISTAITAYTADGMTLGSSSTVNQNAATYHYFSINEASNYFKTGTYTGNATDNRNITGVGFEPEFVISKVTSTTNYSIGKTESTGYNTDVNISGGTNQLQALQADGFQVGTDSAVNASGATYMYLAFAQHDAGLIVDTTADTSDGTVTSLTALRASKGADGKISLREAIAAANASRNGANIDEIDFDISGSGVQTITVTTSDLAAFTDAIYLDGTSQSGYSGSPLISIVDGDTRATGLSLSSGSDGSTIRGFNIQGFGTSGIAISSSNNTIAGNWIGTNSSGTAAAGNYDGIAIWAGDNNIIGGTSTLDRNVLSGQTNNAISISGNGDNTQILGNYIGTDKNGTTLVANSIHGIWIGDSTGTIIGGNTSSRRNVIVSDGYGIEGYNADNLTIQGNYIGLAADGSTILGNDWAGIYLGNGSSGALIGTNADGTNDSAEGNVISGNGNGIILDGSGTTGTTIYGNYIGTDATGLLARGNTYDGVRIQNGAGTNYVGGSGTARRNIIAGNGQDGVQIDGESSDGNFIQNNYIGLASDGVTVLGNGGDGIYISGGADNTTIGGIGLGNVIMGSRVVGIEIDGASSGTTIYGNYIGINIAGTVIQGSGEDGILLENGANSTTIGGTTAGQGNTIVDNGRLSAYYQTGVSIYATSGTGNSVIGNSIYDNRGLGIDLGYEGVNSNDTLDADSGANNLQNFPSISSATTNGSTVTISGSLNSLASTAGILIHFYATPSGGSTTSRQAKRYLGSTTVTTDASGNATFTNVALSSAVTAGELITATATVGSNTSELSQSFVATSSSGNSTPSSLAATSTVDGGLTINSGSGNNVYLEVANGGTILGGRTQLSMEFDFQAEAINNQLYTLASYTTTTDGDALFIGGYKDGGTEVLNFQIGGSLATINYDLDAIFDGNRHSLAFTWNQSGGTYVVYLDGVQIGSGSGLATGQTIASDGTLVLGQDLDTGADTWQAGTSSGFKGTLYDVRVFSDVRTAAEIASGYRTTLSNTASGMIANWRMNDLSTEGTITESVSGNDLTVRQITGGSFTASSPSLTLSVTENASNGTVVGTLYGTDLDRESKITALLAADGNLRYNAETGKFYQVVSTPVSWTTARDNAMSSTLSGVHGQLVTIGSASENAFVTSLWDVAGADMWIGASDQTTEGTWRWQDGTSDGATYWLGNQTGHVVDGLYVNWEPTEPDGQNAADDYARITSTGKWRDRYDSVPYAYVIEWNADDVLDATHALTYSIVSQTVSGAFTINSDTGAISVADSSKLNYESATSQSVTVRVTDGNGAFFDKTFTISLSDVSVESTNSVPSTQTINEDTSLVFSTANGNAISITDQNAGTNSTVQVTLSVASGTLTLSQTTGLTIVSGTNGSSSMVLNGTESNINAALNGLTFTPTSNYNGSLNLQISTAYHADMTGWYTFNDGTANDQSAGTTQNGSFVGNATTITDATRGTVLSLDGTGDSVSISSTFGSPTNVTIGGWVNLNTSAGRAEFISLNDRVHIALDESGTGIKGSIQTGASSWTDLSSGRFIAGTGWHHVMYVFDDTNNVSTLYIDGQVAATATNTSSIYWTGATTTYIGQHPTNTAWNLNGKADDVRIYTRALSSAEVANIAAGMSIDSDTVSINVTSINDAPVLDNSGTMTLTSITEDQTNHSGQTVASIISSAGGDRITDVDSGAVEGIAITSWTGSGGTWQYSTDSGTNWKNVGPVSSTTALLLRSTDLVRFVPDGLAGTTGSLSFSAWDQSSGTAGTYVDASTSGGSTAFSSATEVASITVTSVDDAPTFASGSGQTYTSLTGMQFGNAIAQQSDGKYVIAGWTDGGGTRDFVVARYNTDGSIDTTFGSGNGYVVTAIGTSDEEAQEVRVLSSGKILVSGYAINGGTYDVALVQYNADGSLDTSFGSGTGKVLSGISSTDEGYGFAIQTDGKILIAGGDNNDFLLTRFNSNGTLDTSFGSSGKITTDFSGGSDKARGIALQNDGKIILVGQSFHATTYNDFAVARYNTDGSLDTSFNSTGKRTVDLGTNSTDLGYAVAVQNDGKILVTGFTDAAGTTDAALIRLTSTGSLDTTFNTTGKVITAVGVGSDFGLDLRIQTDGKIVTSGYSYGTSNDFFVARYSTSGSLDTTWGGTGKVTTNFNVSTDDRGTHLLVQADGKVVVVGCTTQSGTYDLAIARYNQDGSADTTFGTASTLGGTVSYTENGSGIKLDTNVTIYDPELSSANNFSGATLSIARQGGANATDQLMFDGITVTTSGANVYVSGFLVGTYTFTGGAMDITFNASATNARVNTLMQNIVYANSSDAPPSSVQLNWTFSDGNTGSQGTGGSLTASGSVTVNITAVNDAPTITNGTNIFLSGTNENTASAGTLASSLLSGSSWADADASPSSGLAITSTTGNGTWQFSTDGSTWTSFGSVSSTGALLITSSTQVRYLPDGNNGETATFTFRAWDQTSGTASSTGNAQYASTASNGGTTAYSTSQATASITVTSVNDAPNAISDSATAVEAGGVSNGTAGTNPTGNVLTNDTDVDTGDTKTVTGVAGGTQSSTSGSVASSVAGSYGSITIASNGSYTYTVDNSNATVQALRTTANTLSDIFSYTVTDGGGLTSTTQITVTIQGANDTPYDLAASGTSVNENATNGTSIGTFSSSDRDSGESFTYSLVDSAGGRFAIGSSSGILTVANSSLLNYEANTSHSITVRVTDAAGAYYDEVFSIGVNDVDEFDVGTVTDTNATTNAVNENASVGTVVGVTANASDADGTTNTITYSLFNNDGGRFTIDANTGVVTVAGAINREVDGASRTITVRATSADGSYTDQNFSIAINDVDEFDVGTVTDANATTNAVNENASVGTVVGITVNASDSDSTTNTITYSLFDNDGGRFTIDANTGVVTVAGAINREADGASRTITVRATSADGSYTDQNFAIAINDVDEFDVGTVSDTNATTNAVNENASVGTVVGITASASDSDSTTNTITYSLFDNDGGRFTIDANTGVVTVAGAINREVDGASRTITVRATSADGSYTDQNLSIAINDVDEFDVGTVTDTNATTNAVNENASVGTVVGITASASDSDSTTNTITYSLFDNDGGRFTIDANTGVVTVAGAINREVDGASRTITVRATSSDGSYTDQNFSIAINDEDEFDVGTVTDTNATTNAVNENASVGTVVGITASASDSDATTNTITYSLFDNDGGRFTIDANTGVVTVAGAINREADGASRTITVRATSADGSYTDQNFAIAINDVDEFDVGTVTDTNATTNAVNENASVGTVVGITASAADSDSTTNTITYSLFDNDGGRFTIDTNTGVVTVAGAINREADGASRTITVRATSADGSYTDQNFSIAINDVDEFDVGTVTDTNATTNAVNENASVGTVVGITASASDSDSTTNTITYSLFDNDGGRFAIDSNTGVVTVAGAINREVDGASRTITVRATSADGSYTDQNFSIAINDVDEFDVGTVTDTNATINAVNENASVGTVVGITASASDSDSTTNTITYSLFDNDGGRFTIDANTGVVTVAGAINREVDGASRTITVRATSADGSYTDQNFSIAINDVDEFDVGSVTDTNAASNQVVENASNGTVVGITSLASDNDATTNTITYTLDDDAGGRFAIDANSGNITVLDGSLLDYETSTSHGITVRATSADGSFQTQNYTIQILDGNEGSVSSISDTNVAGNTVLENATVGTTVGVTAHATDPDGTDVITYGLDDSAGGLFAIDANTGVITVAAAIDRETAGSYTITVRATSTDTSSTTQNYTITIGDIDEFDVGTVTDTNATTNAVNENAANGTVVGITASATDTDATTNTISYTLTDDAGGRFAVDLNTGVVTVADGSLLNREANASHTITVRATSADGSYTDQNFSIAINDVDEFDVGTVSDSNATTNAVSENATLGTVVGITANASDVDATTNTITYSLFDDDGGRFAIDANTGVVTVAGAINREIDGASRTITVRATSTDGSYTDQNFSIAINDVDEFDVGTVTDTNVTSNSVNENAANGTVVGITASATDSDATTNTITYTLTDDAGGRFAVDLNTGVVSVADGSLLNRESNASHTITVRATSADGSYTDQNFSIAIDDVDEFDVGTVTDTNATTNAVNENASVGTVVGITASASDSDATTNTITYSLFDNDGGRFTIDANTGVVTVAGAINREVDGASRTITVRATSADGSYTDQNFSIAINDVDEFDVGTVTDTNATTNAVNENASIGTAVGITATASDSDATTNTITYSLFDNDGGRFTIDANTGVVTVAGAINREADGSSRTITVRATSSDGSFTDQNFSIAINDVDEFDVGTVSDSNAASNQVVENASNGTVVGITAFATDSDATTNAIAYSLDDNANGRFAIDINTGVITVLDGSLLDYETSTSHGITVRATSADGSFQTQNYTIQILDTNEGSVSGISDTNAASDTVLENASIGTTVGITARATDPDGTDVITYALDDSAGGLFAIDSNTGVVTVAGAINREIAGSYTITVRATSTDTSSTTQNYSIIIGDMDEFDVGTVSDTNATSNSVNENAASGTTVGITAAAFDNDATTNTVTYTLTDSAGGRFAVDLNTGVVTVADGSLLNREANASHVITVRATSADGSYTDQNFSIAINDVDEFDVGTLIDTNATTDAVQENASIGTVVGITANASDSDATTNAVTYSLFDNDGGRFAIDASTGIVTVAGAINRETDGASRTITIRATSADGSFTDQNVSIAINDVDEFDVGTVSDTNATTNSVQENATNGTTVGITAAASDNDATSNAITYTLTDSAGGRFAVDLNTGAVTVADGSLLDRETNASHTITVRATSADGSYTDQNFSIAINDVDEFDVGTVSDTNATSNAVNENASIGTVVGITANASDVDATTNTITYSLFDDDGGRFAIDANTGIVTVAGAINREIDGASRTITVRATSIDGSHTDQNFSIAINDVDEFDVGSVSDTDAIANAIDENATNGTTVGITAAASDSDATSNNVTYTLTNDAGGGFAVDLNTGIVTVADGTLLNREANASHLITVRATSADGSYTDQNFSIAVNDVDEFDVGTVTDTNATSNAINENASVGAVVGITASASDSDATTNTITYSLFDDDGGRFAIDANTGVVTIAGAINRETDGAARTITVRATSADGSYTDQNFSIAINDVDEFDVGSVADTDATLNSVNENAALGTTIGITASAFDSDATTNTVTYTLFDDDGGRFAIDAITGVVTVAGAIDRESDGASRSITVRATSADGSYTDQTLSIAIQDVDEFDVGAIIDSDSSVNAVQENATNGSLVGLTVSAFDFDALQNAVTYRLLDDAGGRFTIDANTGVVTVLQGTLLNFEAQSTHQIQVEAQSQDGSISTQTFTIALQNIQEQPTGSSDQYSTNFVETLSVGGSGVLLNDVDPDGNPLQAILVSGPLHGTLVLNADGTFVFTPEAGYTGQVSFTYRASDGQLQSSDVLVTIEIVMPPAPPPTSGSNSSGGSGSSSSSDSSSSSSGETESGQGSSSNSNSNETSSSTAGSLAPVGIEEKQSKQTSAASTQETTAVQVAALSTLDTPQEASILATTNTGLSIHLQGNSNTLLLGDTENRDMDSSRRTLSSSSTETLMEWSDVRRTELLDQKSALPIQGVVVQTVLGTGVVIWVVQGIQLLATLLSATPAWIQFDPLNVIAGGTNTKEDEEDEASQAIHLFDNKKS